MKLAEARLVRADQKKKVPSLCERIAENALAQEGDPRREGANRLVAECCAVVQEQQGLILHINASNTRRQLADGRPPGQRARGARHADTAARRAQAGGASTRKDSDRYSMREIKWMPQIDVVATQKQTEGLAPKIRDLNVHIQQANWQVDLDGA